MIHVYILFLILLKSVKLQSQGNVPQQFQCPCILKPGTRECLQYDTRFQAVTIQEAMDTFVDLSMGDEAKPPEQVKTYDEERCVTKECQACRKSLKHRLKQIGLLHEQVDPDTIAAQLSNGTSESCSKYRFTRKEAEAYEYWTRKAKKHKKKHSSESDESNEKEKKSILKEYLKWFEFDKRHKRQTPPTNAGIVGTRFNISCTPKGVATDGSGFLSLCSKCWSWRQLPPNYMPQYINEVTCDEGDSNCLSGYATCGDATRTLEVIRNDTGALAVVTLTAGSFCECRVKTGSPLENLVTGLPGSFSLAALTTATLT